MIPCQINIERYVPWNWKCMFSYNHLYIDLDCLVKLELSRAKSKWWWTSKSKLRVNKWAKNIRPCESPNDQTDWFIFVCTLQPNSIDRWVVNLPRKTNTIIQIKHFRIFPVRLHPVDLCFFIVADNIIFVIVVGPYPPKFKRCCLKGSTAYSEKVYGCRLI